MFFCNETKYHIVWSSSAGKLRGNCVITSPNKFYDLIDTQVALLAIALGGVYSRPARGYRISETSARRFQNLFENGYRADFNRSIKPPDASRESTYQLELAI